MQAAGYPLHGVSMGPRYDVSNVSGHTRGDESMSVAPSGERGAGAPWTETGRIGRF
jgi:hypothetical protein